MKKSLFILMAMMGILTAQADDTTFPYLTFETTDGIKSSVSVSSDQTITISGTTLTIGGLSFTLANLSKMYFSTSDQTTGISEIMKADLEEATEIYDLRGCKITKDQMSHGVYVIKTKKGTFKVNVR